MGSNEDDPVGVAPKSCGSSTCMGEASCSAPSSQSRPPRESGLGSSAGSAWRAEKQSLDKPLLGSNGQQSKVMCMKCSVSPAEVLARQNEPLCRQCLIHSLSTKVRHVVKQKGLIEPGDQILAAVSGGPSSVAMLQLLRQVQNTNEARLARGKVAFKLGGVFIDESSYGAAELQADNVLRGSVVKAMVACGIDETNVHFVHMEDVFCLGDSFMDASPTDAARQGARDQLHALLEGVADPTGKGNLWEALRTLLLLKVAKRLGYTKVARGDNASTLAKRAIAGVCKGVGGALPASLQWSDARYGGSAPTIILPLRELPAKDLTVLSSLHGLNSWPCQNAPVWEGRDGSISLNSVAERFVEDMQLRLPSAASTIMRVMDRLEDFPFNHLAKSRGYSEAAEPQPETMLCSICAAPLSDGEGAAAQSERDYGGVDDSKESQPADHVCGSCSKYIIPPLSRDSSPRSTVDLVRLMHELQVDVAS